MSRSLRASPRSFSTYQPTEDAISVPVPGFLLKGMDTDTMLNEMEIGFSRLVRNLAIRQASYQLRPGTSVIGSQSVIDLLAVIDVPLSTGVNKLVRWHKNGVEIWSGAAWVAAGGTAWTGLDALGVPFASTGWGDTVIFTCGVGKLFELSFGPNTLTELTDSPEDVIHLATFGKRVVATTKEGIYWTVSGDSHDWTGLGSGFEDLKSSPDGSSDIPTAVIPITDEFAGHVRTKSVWQMTLTGDFDAPFAFSKLPFKVGSQYPQSCVSTGRSLMCVGDEGAVWDVTLEKPTDVADRIKSLIAEAQLVDNVHPLVGVYDPRYDEYRLIVTADEVQRVLRYNRQAAAWTEDTYSFPIRNISYTNFKDLPSNGKLRPGYLYAMGDTWGYVVRDDPDRDNELYRDVDKFAIPIVMTFRIESGHLKRTDDGLLKDFYEMILWYLCESPMILKFLYSDDDGQTWNIWFDIGIGGQLDRIVPMSITVPTLSRNFLQVAVSCNSSKNIRLNKLECWMRESGRIVDAS